MKKNVSSAFLLFPLLILSAAVLPGYEGEAVSNGGTITTMESVQKRRGAESKRI